jgi:hypothetical protein
MTRSTKSLSGHFLLALCLAAPGVAAPPSLTEKQEITLLVAERLRRAPQDMDRAYRAGVELLRGGPADAAALHAAALTARSRGLKNHPKADPRVGDVLRRRWEDYVRAKDALVEAARRRRDENAPPGPVYWELTGRYKDLMDATRRAMVFNDPPEGDPLEKAFLKDERAVLLALEFTPLRTQGQKLHVVLPAAHPRIPPLDIGDFFAAQTMLPTTRPLEKGAFTVPVHSRTVQKRVSGRKWIFRVARGQGLLHLGEGSTPIRYGYTEIPPDMPYCFENTGDEPLEIDYIVMGL